MGSISRKNNMNTKKVYILNIVGDKLACARSNIKLAHEEAIRILEEDDYILQEGGSYGNVYDQLRRGDIAVMEGLDSENNPLTIEIQRFIINGA